MLQSIYICRNAISYVFLSHSITPSTFDYLWQTRVQRKPIKESLGMVPRIKHRWSGCRGGQRNKRFIIAVRISEDSSFHKRISRSRTLTLVNCKPAYKISSTLRSWHNDPLLPPFHANPPTLKPVFFSKDKIAEHFIQ